MFSFDLQKKKKKKPGKKKKKGNLPGHQAHFGTLFVLLLRARSKIPVVVVTGCSPGWPGALKLPGAAYSRGINSIRQKGSA